MATVTRRAAAVVTAASLALGLLACGTAGDDVRDEEAPRGENLVIGLLLADAAVTRWESFDRPLIERRIQELCDTCAIEVSNAGNDVAVQHQQLGIMITHGVDVVIVNAVDSKSIGSAVKRADESGIPVIAYDRLAEGPISGYVSFDGHAVGRLQGRALLRALGDEAANSRIVMMNGSPTDPNAGLFKEGAQAVLTDRVRIGKEFDILGWSTEGAYGAMASAVADLGANEIDAVYAASDSIAAGAIAALRAANVEPLPPVTGQDAELAAVQRIVDGSQYMTVYKPYQREAFPAAEMAVALARGETLEGIARDHVANDTVDDIPAVYAEPISVTAANVDEDIVRRGLFTVEEICTPRFASACDRAGLTG
ncbi:sugar ABC transporter substrate-binding protein [Streptomyces litchfieldiae]|uniref:Substrate-binding domain-containing protein n=1 Tax=Streptomyces litchfieldiae TaxID=3075543 RepID=A0ABU2MME1_9ACTN|nr:substrate-binding domain-containing protein [Streptomyces sp. DSM 44938]MDT0342769.1 substrate-binding domain-containing protein [Streptomyces sp. DSM 44938]